MDRRRFLRLAGLGCTAALVGVPSAARPDGPEPRDGPGEMTGAPPPVTGAVRADRPVPRRSPVPEMDPGSLRSTFVEVDGLRMHMLVSRGPAPRTAPAIVLVHGSGLSGQYMIPTARALAANFRVYVPDIPGYGDSADPGRILDVPAMADWLAAWMPATGLERASFLGNSFGCQVIADLAARYPQRVQAAVLQGPTTPPAERSAFWQFIRWRQNQAYNPAWLEDVTGPDYPKAGFWRLVRSFMSQVTDRIEAKAPAIAAPTLVVRGEFDPIATPDFCDLIVRLLPHGRLHIIPGVAHTLVSTAPGPLAAATREFIREVT